MGLRDKLGALKNAISIEKLRESKLLAPVFLWYDNLPPDQKNIANAALIGGAVFLLLFVLYLGNSKISTLEEEIAAKEQMLKELRRYEAEFSEQTDLLRQLEREAKQKGADFSVLATLESLAQQSNIGRESIESISPKQLPPGKYFIETEATVQMVHVTLKQLIHFFYKIEASEYNLMLKEVRLRPRFDNPQFLNISFKVSSFMPKG